MTSSLDEVTSSLALPESDDSGRSLLSWPKSDMGLFNEDLADDQMERPTVTRRYPLTLYAELGARSEGRHGSGGARTEGSRRQLRLPQMRLPKMHLPQLRMPQALLTPIGKRKSA